MSFSGGESAIRLTLIDSSIWVDYFRPRPAAALRERVQTLIRASRVVATGIVLVEILRGARAEEEFAALQEALGSIPLLPLTQEVCERAARWGFQLDRRGKVVSTTDLLIAAAAYPDTLVLHRDRDFETIADAVALHQEYLKG